MEIEHFRKKTFFNFGKDNVDISNFVFIIKKK